MLHQTEVTRTLNLIVNLCSLPTYPAWSIHPTLTTEKKACLRYPTLRVNCRPIHPTPPMYIKKSSLTMHIGKIIRPNCHTLVMRTKSIHPIYPNVPMSYRRIHSTLPTSAKKNFHPRGPTLVTGKIVRLIYPVAVMNTETISHLMRIETISRPIHPNVLVMNIEEIIYNTSVMSNCIVFMMMFDGVLTTPPPITVHGDATKVPMRTIAVITTHTLTQTEDRRIDPQFCLRIIATPTADWSRNINLQSTELALTIR
uniref:Uncharacterized protein n=1 Tax=Cacopsylla melanoneura TaxID=428564 RepID=A0A8D8TE79_9HEMI